LRDGCHRPVAGKRRHGVVAGEFPHADRLAFVLKSHLALAFQSDVLENLVRAIDVDLSQGLNRRVDAPSSCGPPFSS
jgi:hypothetical protein